MDVVAEHLTLSIPSHPRYLCVLRGFFGDLLAELGFSSNDIMRVTLAIHEACANVIEHAYHGDHGQRIDLEVHIAPEDVTVEVQDYGTRVSVEAIKPRDLGEIRPGGLGTHFMQAIMDEVVYSPGPETGMRLRMTKRRSVPCKSP